MSDYPCLSQAISSLKSIGFYLFIFVLKAYSSTCNSNTRMNIIDLSSSHLGETHLLCYDLWTFVTSFLKINCHTFHDGCRYLEFFSLISNIKKMQIIFMYKEIFLKRTWFFIFVFLRLIGGKVDFHENSAISYLSCIVQARKAI